MGVLLDPNTVDGQNGVFPFADSRRPSLAGSEGSARFHYPVESGTAKPLWGIPRLALGDCVIVLENPAVDVQ